MLLGIDIDLRRRWIEHQFSPDMNWSNVRIDHVKPIVLFNVSKDKELGETFNCKNTQTLLKNKNLQTGGKFTLLDYRMQFFKACQFIKTKEERPN